MRQGEKDWATRDPRVREADDNGAQTAGTLTTLGGLCWVFVILFLFVSRSTDFEPHRSSSLARWGTLPYVAYSDTFHCDLGDTLTISKGLTERSRNFVLVKTNRIYLVYSLQKPITELG